MKFGMFYEHQLPQPWGEDSERRLYPGGARPGGTRRQTRHRLCVGGRASLPGGILAFLRAGDFPRRLLAAHAAHPAGPWHRADAAEIQSSRARGGAHRDTRSGVERTRRLGHRGVGDRAGDGRLQHPARGKERDVARGDRAGRQHAGDAALSRLPRQVFRHAVPQSGAEVGAEAASADVGGVLEARDHPSRRARRIGRADLRVPGTRAGSEVGAGILRHHQITGVRADRPQRQSEHRAGHRHVVPYRRAGGDPARPRWLPLLRLFARLYRHLRRNIGPASPTCGSSSSR